MNRVYVALLGVLLASTSCSEAQSDAKGNKRGGKGGKKKDKTSVMNPVAGLTRLGNMPAEVPESSGLARGPEPGTFYTHGDHGNTPTLYLVRQSGELVRRVEIPGIQQEDWESVAQDAQGRLYIGDCGNNSNTRQDLTIYRVDPNNPAQVSTIRFSYPDQTAFPPPKNDRNFDVESSLWHNGTLYLFTRNRARGRDCKIYTLQADGPAQQTAKLLGQITLPGEVTDANLSPDGKHLALLGREQLYLCDVKGGNFTKAKARTVELPGAGQTEGLVFTDNQTLVISTEQGVLYQYKLQ
ncbi:hypothetical protein F0P96_12100 [Hymenobacter busanensis]|uniref:Uncharacterized protein n=1 Tax=Hymenobacter busanensis TaxID=2607656 RepID=A0A7L4ZWS8_9BACT|nr:hypothetical protein [Hymenobacter busanensis]KAA9332219.1 hypothetical protein F0P96_12100 [Hymenobacter busanensis]QHJ07443.1 hypothetical protein GUY19_09170 [Hymenobacter busanensis]